MSETTPKPEINDEAYNTYMANELGLEEIMDLGHLEAEDRLKLELMVENAKIGVGLLPNDPTVRAAVNALLCEQRGYSTDDTVEKKMDVQSERTLSSEQTEKLLNKLEARFNANKKHHKNIEWSKVEARLNEASPEKLWSLNEMERTGGEPDVKEFVEETGEFEFWDTSKESPEGRRNVCYDCEGQDEAEKRREDTAGNAIDMAKDEMGLGGILNREQIKELGKLVKGLFSESYSWVDTPEETRKREVALFASRFYAGVKVFESYPGNRDVTMGFHGWLRV